MNIAEEEIFEYMIPKVRSFPCEYALIFGTRHGIDEFVSRIATLRQESMIDKLIISGGITPGESSSEARILAEKLKEKGVPQSSLILEEGATNTGENVEFSRTLAKHLNLTIKDLALVGKISSCRRYLMTVRKQWPEIQKVCIHNVNYFSVETRKWTEDVDFINRVLSEYQKIPEYLSKGFLKEIDVVDGIVY